MGINKICELCKAEKSLDNFFTHRAKVGMYCKQCHLEGKVQHGYGWYKDKWNSPSDTGASAIQLKHLRQQFLPSIK
jgi:hypothetical protein